MRTIILTRRASASSGTALGRTIGLANIGQHVADDLCLWSVTLMVSGGPEVADLGHLLAIPYRARMCLGMFATMPPGPSHPLI